MTRDRRGFSFIEMLLVMLVLGILAGIGILRYIELKHRALSSRVTADMTAIRLAAYNAMYDGSDWPAEAPAGVIPPEMQPHLATGFSFVRDEYTLDWENLGKSSGAVQIGVSVKTKDPRLMETLKQTIGNRGTFIAVGDQITLVIVGPNGEG